MDLIIVAAVAETIRMVVRFFGQLAAQEWGRVVIELTDLLTLPFGVDAIRTPYGGVFDVDAALTIAVLLLAEWALSVVRSRVPVKRPS
jgi:hypothetical protein